MTKDNEIVNRMMNRIEYAADARARLCGFGTYSGSFLDRDANMCCSTVTMMKELGHPEPRVLYFMKLSSGIDWPHPKTFQDSRRHREEVAS
jgi:hypothetical protein